MLSSRLPGGHPLLSGEVKAIAYAHTDAGERAEDDKLPSHFGWRQP